MGYALITSAQAGAPDRDSAATTPNRDTTGANLIVLKGTTSWSGTGGTEFTDNKSNTWTKLTGYGSGPAGNQTQIAYCFGPTVGASHTFSYAFGNNAYANIQMLAFSGAVSSPFDAENGGTTSGGTNLRPEQVTPSEDNELIVTGIGLGAGTGAADDFAIDSGFTIQEITTFSLDNHISGAIAYLIQTSAASVNPYWSWTGTYQAVAAIASFKGTAPAAGGQPTMRRWGGVPFMGTQKLRNGGRGGPWARDSRSGLLVPRRLAA